MKKLVISNFISIVSTAIILICINAYANTSINSEDVLYYGNTIQDSIDDLYDKSSYGDAVSGNILEGKKALIQGNKIIGTMIDLSNTIQTATTSTADRTKSAYKWDSGIVIAPGNGYWGNWDWSKSAIKVPAADFGGAATSSVLSGQTFTSSNGLKQTGTMANWSNTIQTASTSTPSGKSAGQFSLYRVNGSNIEVIPAYGYYGAWDWSKEIIKVPVPANQNSGTYTYAANSTGGTVDLGATNTYRYVNASNVYAKGKADGIDFTLVLSYQICLGWNGNTGYGCKDGSTTIKRKSGQTTISSTGGSNTSISESWNGTYYINSNITNIKVSSFTIN